jgi:REP element-mobilizing transposase RayT
MSFVQVWIHAVWSTKNREALLTVVQRKILFQHIRENARNKGIHISVLNGHTDHVHCLFALNPEIPLAKTMQLIKGEASHWANEQKLFGKRLEWAGEYFAASVSESVLEKVKSCINNQEEHHRKITFQQEYEMFLKKYAARYVCKEDETMM